MTATAEAASTPPAPEAAVTGRPRRPGLLPEARAGLVVAAVVTLIGAPAGLLWTHIAPHAPIAGAEGGAVLSSATSETAIAADARLLVIGLAAGLVIGLVTGVLAARRLADRSLGLLVGAAVGGLLAGLVAWRTGHAVGLDDFRAFVQANPIGRQSTMPVDLRAKGVLAAWPAGTLVGFLLAYAVRAPRG